MRFFRRPPQETPTGALTGAERREKFQIWHPEIGGSFTKYRKSGRRRNRQFPGLLDNFLHGLAGKFLEFPNNSTLLSGRFIGGLLGRFMGRLNGRFNGRLNCP